MIKIKFLFSKQYNSFRVFVPNLEKLSVQQIQEVEKFVKLRKGFFDFETYSFIINKNIDFNEFVTLIKHSNLDAICEENEIITKTNFRISFGNYKGMLYSEIPDNYLLWLKKNYFGKDRDMIDSELNNRKL